MQRLLKTRPRKVGLPPGTLVYTGTEKERPARITLIDYDETVLQEREVASVEACLELKDTPSITWINVDSIHDAQIIQTLGDAFGIHPLVLEDVMSPRQRPKVEDYENLLYIVVRMIRYNTQREQVEDEQVSFILGQNFLITFQEKPEDVFEPVRDRLRAGQGRLRRMKADYLAYALIDAIVDGYFVVLEHLGERIEALEEEVLERPSPETLQQLNALKRELLLFRKSVWPLREAISNLERTESPLIQEATQVFLRDVYDHTIQVIDAVETYRDMVGGIVDTYLSSVSNKMNEVMKMLTLIATIFIPLTFIAGIYGMNFDFMPELHWRWAYPVVWLIMIVVAFGMVIHFRRKRWL